MILFKNYTLFDNCRSKCVIVSLPCNKMTIVVLWIPTSINITVMCKSRDYTKETTKARLYFEQTLDILTSG